MLNVNSNNNNNFCMKILKTFKQKLDKVTELNDKLYI